MPAPRASFLHTHRRTILALLFGLAFSATLAYAVPPGSQYIPGETLDPICAPGDTNCSVNITPTVAWGAITGTLSNQTDLQTALNAKFDDPAGTTAQYLRGDGSLGTLNATGLIALQTDGVSNGSQALLNLVGGTGISLTDDGVGGVTIDANVSADTIYTADGTISGSRTIDLGGNDFNIVDPGSGGRVGIYIDSPGFISNFGSNPTDGFAYVQVNNDVNGITLSGTNIILSGGVVIPGGATDGYILTSDGFGNASWQAPAEGGGGDSPISIVNTSSLVSTGLPRSGSISGAIRSIFLGPNTANNATNAFDSFFAGEYAGANATNAKQSIFIGSLTGQDATNASVSVFLGNITGNGATNAERSVFIGNQAGSSATNAERSVFIGEFSGSSSTDAERSVFIGNQAGSSAINASLSVFLGSGAGVSALNAANSIFIGTGTAGANVNNTAAYDDLVTFANTSILIGHRASTGGFSNSIAIGAYAANTDEDQFMIGSSSRPIDSTVFVGTAGTSCTITTGTSMSCSSDERLKTNIEDLESDTLEKLLAVRTVSYNWTSRPDADQMVGFLAQDLEQYFPQLVSTGPGDYLQVNYAGMTPVLVEAIREMNLKITSINDIDTENNWRTALVEWFASATNGIGKFFAGEITTKTLCVADESGAKTCLTKGQLDSVLSNLNTIGPGTTTIVMPAPDVVEEGSEPTEDPAVPTPDPEQAPVDPEPEIPAEVPAETPPPTPSEPAPELSTPSEPGQ